MSTNEVKTHHDLWVAALFTGNEPSMCELDIVIFGLSFSKDRLEAILAGSDHETKLTDKKDACLSLLTSSLTSNGMTTLEDLEATPLSLVSGIPEVSFNGRYLPPSMVGPLISAKDYLSLRRIHPSLSDIRELTLTQLERYLSPWSSAKQKGLFPCDEKVSFDGNSESWPGFCIELTGILINHGLRELLYFASVSASAPPERLFFQSMWLGGMLKIAVNNFPLMWPMHEVDNDGVALLLWMKIKYESAAKLDTLRIYYSEKMRSLKLKVNGSLHCYIDRFQGLAILWREIDPSVQAEDKLVT